ncbi:MAG: DNA-binding protein [Burkholderiaceae bacterium]|jgi:hypothetical protein|nr:DNA-binding protein [Burkholderiaceae bacterium]
MARPGITREQVGQAIDALQSQGREPTLRNIRLQIGRGSYCTLLRYLDELLPNRRRHRRAKPPAQWVRSQCDAAFRSLWTSAYRRAAQELASKHSGADAAVMGALRSLAISRAEVQSMQRLIQGFAQRIWRLETQLSDATRERNAGAHGDERNESTSVGNSGLTPVSWARPYSTSRHRRCAVRGNATATELKAKQGTATSGEEDIAST